jgi:hypothetical protein
MMKYSLNHATRPTCALLHRNKHATASAAVSTVVAVRRIAMKEKIAARAKKSAARAPSTGASSRKPAKRDEASRALAQTNSQPTVEEDNSGKRDVDSAIARTLTTVTRSTADFNLQLLEMARSNANSAFDFAHRLMGMQSPSELLEVSATQARKQFESFTAQTRQLITLAQEGWADAAAPLTSGAASAFARTARSDNPD